MVLDEAKLKSLFLHLLRSAMWESEADTSLFPLSLHEWQWIFVTAARHTLTAVVYDAINALPEAIKPGTELMSMWKKIADSQEQECLRHLRTVNYLHGRLQSSGITPTVVKGLSLAVCYPHPRHRHTGDIDLFFGSVERKNIADRTVEEWGIPVERKLHDESIYMVGNVVVEHHGHLFQSHNLWVRTSARKRLQAALSSEEAYCQEDILGSDLTTLHPDLALLLLVCHSYKHVINSGIGLRQLADLALFLKKAHADIHPEVVARWASDWKMTGWTRCLMATLCKYLGMPSDYSPVEPGGDKDADVLMNEVWMTANFGQTDSRYVPVGGASANRKTTVRRLLHNYRLFAHYSYGEATGSLMLLVYIRLKECLNGRKSESSVIEN